jgi:hypothetical protein
MREENFRRQAFPFRVKLLATEETEEFLKERLGANLSVGAKIRFKNPLWSREIESCQGSFFKKSFHLTTIYFPEFSPVNNGQNGFIKLNPAGDACLAAVSGRNHCLGRNSCFIVLVDEISAFINCGRNLRGRDLLTSIHGTLKLGGFLLLTLALPVPQLRESDGQCGQVHASGCPTFARESSVSLCPGVDVMIAIFCDFQQFSAIKLAFFAKPNVMINFSFLLNKKRHFFRRIFRRKYF